MGFLSYGSAKGLSVENDYQQDIDRLYQREAYKAQVKAEKERKSAFYAQLMQEQTAATPNNQSRLTEYYTQVANEVADFSLTHPHWESDVMQSQQMYSIMGKYTNNDIIREDKEVQQQWELTKNAVNSKNISQSEYEKNAERYKNYMQNGGDPYVFINPKRLSTNEILADYNKRLASNTYDITDPKSGQISRVTSTDPDAIHNDALSILANDDYKVEFQKDYDDVPENDKGLFTSLLDYTEKRLAAGEEMVNINGGYDEKKLIAYREGLQNDGKSGYHRFYMNNVYSPLAQGQEVAAHPANVAFTEFGKEGEPLQMGNGGRVVKGYTKGPDGEQNFVGDLHLKGDVKQVGSGKIKMCGGIPYAEMYVTVTLSDNQIALDDQNNPVEKSVVKQEENKKRRKKEKENKDVDDVLMKDQLEKYGFTKILETTNSSMSMAGFNNTTERGDVYKGTILVPATFNESNRMQYDLSFGTTKEKLSEAASMYDQNYNIAEVISSRNIPVASSIINEKKGANISASIGYDSSTLEWQQNPDAPTEFAARVKTNDGSEKYVRYDFNTNTYQIVK